jgi:hypothetical protein
MGHQSMTGLMVGYDFLFLFGNDTRSAFKPCKIAIHISEGLTVNHQKQDLPDETRSTP